MGGPPLTILFLKEKRYETEKLRPRDSNWRNTQGIKTTKIDQGLEKNME